MNIFVCFTAFFYHNIIDWNTLYTRYCRHWFLSAALCEVRLSVKCIFIKCIIY